jgi:hypothetical protein
MKQTHLFPISIITVFFGFIIFVFGIITPEPETAQNALLASAFLLPLGLSYIIISYINSWFDRRRSIATGSEASTSKKSHLVLKYIGFVIVFGVLQGISFIVYFFCGLFKGSL